jgi:hypothetical protein
MYSVGGSSEMMNDLVSVATTSSSKVRFNPFSFSKKLHFLLISLFEDCLRISVLIVFDGSYTNNCIEKLSSGERESIGFYSILG